MIAIGLMSGTSLDGVDAALVRILPQGARYRVDLLNFLTAPFDARLSEALRSALPPNRGSIEAAARLHHDLGEALASAAFEVMGDMPVDYVASHGQTLWHDGDAHVTLQLGDAFIVRERIEATVCYDFRSADCAAGGLGAPLVPYADALLLGSGDEHRIAVNVGGIANLTYIPRAGGPGEVIAFDTGPGNMLIDLFVRERTGGTAAFDRDGAFAARGNVDAAALRAMSADDFFSQPPPKTTGRERFGAQFLAGHGSLLSQLSLEDGAATLTALTAHGIAEGVRVVAGADRGARILVSGGGAHNRALLAVLSERLPGYSVERSDAMGVNPDAKEALAFALLGYETLRERCANVPLATGAEHAAVLGAIAPHDLRNVLAKVEKECRA